MLCLCDINGLMQRLNFVAFDRVYCRILHHQTKFYENRTIRCRVMAKTFLNSIWRPSAVLSLKLLSFGRSIFVIVPICFCLQNFIDMMTFHWYGNESGDRPPSWFFQLILKIFTFDRRRIVHLYTKFCENQTIHCGVMAKTKLSNMASICHLEFKNSNFVKLFLSQSSAVWFGVSNFIIIGSFFHWDMPT